MLIVAAINLLVVTRKIRAASSESAPGWWRRFAALIALELIGVVAVLVFVGRMTGMEPARPILAERENQQSIAFKLGERSATLSMAPGTPGRTIFVSTSGRPMPANATANVLLVPPVEMAGQKSVDLQRTTGNTFEAHTAEMSVVGDWGMTSPSARSGHSSGRPRSPTRPPSGSRARARSVSRPGRSTAPA